jgi:hypothetical protein
LIAIVVAALVVILATGEILIRRNREAADDVKQKITPTSQRAGPAGNDAAGSA